MPTKPTGIERIMSRWTHATVHDRWMYRDTFDFGVLIDRTSTTNATPYLLHMLTVGIEPTSSACRADVSNQFTMRALV